VRVVRGYRARPGDAALVVMLLDCGGHDPGRADPVAPHNERTFPAFLVEEGGVERLRVEGPQLENVSDLDRCLKAKLATALRAGVALPRLADVREPGLEVAAGLHAAKMPAVRVRAGNELSLPERLVGDDLDRRADRAQ